MYDIHTHLYWHSYDGDRDEVLRRAREAGVEKMIVVGTTVEESVQAVNLAEKHPELYASIGIHPHFFNDHGISDLEFLLKELKTLARNERVVAIGECGLDYYSHDRDKTINDVQRSSQKEGFLAQIEVAAKLNLPLIVHCRTSSSTGDDAYRDLLEILKSISRQIKAIILHCYMGDTEVTKEFLKLPNVYFSFAGNITYPVKKSLLGTKDDLTGTVKLAPLERIFVETDCPFLAPEEYRGERNEPAWLVFIGERIAMHKNISLGDINIKTTENYIRVFSREIN